MLSLNISHNDYCDLILCQVPLPIPDGFGSSPTEGIFIQVVRNKLACT